MSVSFNLKFYVGDELFCSEINVDALAEFTFTKLLEELHALAPIEQVVGLKWIDVENESVGLRNDADLAVALRNLHLVAGKRVLRVRLPQPAVDLGKATTLVSSVRTVPEDPTYVLAIVCKEEVVDDVQEAIDTAPSAELGSSADIPEARGYIDLGRGVESAALVAHIKLEPKVENADDVQHEEGSLDTAYLSAMATTSALDNGTASHQAPDRRGRKSPPMEEEESELEQNGFVESDATPNNRRVNAAANVAERKHLNTPPAVPASTTPSPPVISISVDNATKSATVMADSKSDRIVPNCANSALSKPTNIGMGLLVKPPITTDAGVCRVLASLSRQEEAHKAQKRKQPIPDRKQSLPNKRAAKEHLSESIVAEVREEPSASLGAVSIPADCFSRAEPQQSVSFTSTSDFLPASLMAPAAISPPGTAPYSPTVPVDPSPAEPVPTSPTTIPPDVLDLQPSHCQSNSSAAKNFQTSNELIRTITEVLPLQFEQVLNALSTSRSSIDTKSIVAAPVRGPLLIAKLRLRVAEKMSKHLSDLKSPNRKQSLANALTSACSSSPYANVSSGVTPHRGSLSLAASLMVPKCKRALTQQSTTDDGTAAGLVCDEFVLKQVEAAYQKATNRGGDFDLKLMSFLEVFDPHVIVVCKDEDPGNAVSVAATASAAPANFTDSAEVSSIADESFAEASDPATLKQPKEEPLDEISSSAQRCAHASFVEQRYVRDLSEDIIQRLQGVKVTSGFGAAGKRKATAPAASTGAKKRRKKAAASSSSETNKSIWIGEDLIFAKLKGHPYWPARVEDPEKFEDLRTDRQKSNKPFRVFFFGTHQHGFCSKEDIMSYDDAMKKYGNSKKGNVQYQSALQEIAAAREAEAAESGLVN